jgi:hypothetical protein
MLVAPYEAFYLGFVLRKLYRCKISKEWFSLVCGGGKNHDD